MLNFIQKKNQNNHQPQTNRDLKALVRWAIVNHGESADLNFIDTSRLVDFGHVFSGWPYTTFNGDISQWNTSNAKDMDSMFFGSSFNGDISNWNVSKVIDMRSMFNDSQFNGDISHWDVSKVESMAAMFHNSQFNGDISQWNTQNAETMYQMFNKSVFNGDVSNWNVSQAYEIEDMFTESNFTGDISQWTPSIDEDPLYFISTKEEPRNYKTFHQYKTECEVQRLRAKHNTVNSRIITAAL